MKKKNFIITLSLILVALIAAGGYLVVKKYMPTKKTIDLKMVIPGKEAGSDEAYIFKNDKYLEKSKGVVKNGEFFMPLEIASEIDSKYYIQKGTDKLYFTDSKATMKLSENSKQVSIGTATKELAYEPYIKVGKQAYISVKFVSERSKATVVVAKEPNRIIIRDNLGSKTATIAKGEGFRSHAGIKSPITYSPKEEKVFLIKEFGEWTKVTNIDGQIGYIRTKYLKNPSVFKGNEKYDGKYQYFSLDKKIILGWHQVTNTAANEFVGDVKGVQSGINVISPTWFAINDNAGNIKSIGSLDYVNKMHAKGISVWVLVDDFAPHIDMLEVLSNEASRKNLINTLVSNTESLGADGINIDFENITKDSSPSFLQFLRELYLATRRAKLVVSVDNYVPREYNKHYLRDEQAEVTDYTIIMGYDEHAGNSKVSGSVASIDFVRSGIEKTIAEVPANKVINAIPFYTRLWEEVPLTDKNSANASAEEKEAGVRVKATSIGMKAQEKVIKDKEISLNWIDKDKQNYGESIKAGVKYKIWVEDKRSVEAKLNLIKENKLAGVATWKLGLETDDVWPLINEYMK